MKCQFQLISNTLKGGESCLLTYQGSTEPKNVIGKKCIIKVFEIDDKGKNDLLAEFATVIVQASLPDHGKFDPSQTTRTDHFNNTLPGPEYHNDPKGNLLPVPLNYKPAHFKLNLHGASGHIILMQGDKGEIEGCVFEIGFSISIEGIEVYNSFKTPAYVNCSNLLMENCTNAAAFFKNNHDEQVNLRGVGTHFGDHYPYYEQMMGTHDYSSEPAFAQNVFDKFKKDIIDYGLQKSSCIGFVHSCMEMGFLKAGMKNDWTNIWGYVKQERGDLLAKGLVENGWQAYYYNPDVNHPNDDAPQGTTDSQEASEHTFSYTKAKNERVYYGIPVSGYIINYYPTTISPTLGFRQVASFYRAPSTTTSKTIIPRNILNANFGFVLARGGKHTAMYSKGKILELHWDVEPYRSPTHPLFDISNFITEWAWNSGIIVFPPGGIK